MVTGAVRLVAEWNVRVRGGRAKPYFGSGRGEYARMAARLAATAPGPCSRGANPVLGTADGARTSGGRRRWAPAGGRLARYSRPDRTAPDQTIEPGTRDHRAPWIRAPEG